MKKALLLAALLSLAACKKTRVKECDDFVATAKKIQKCDKLPQSSRDSMSRALTTIEDALKAIEDVDPPQSQLDMLAKTCKSQHDTIRNLYEKSAPECLK